MHIHNSHCVFEWLICIHPACTIKMMVIGNNIRVINLLGMNNEYLLKVKVNLELFLGSVESDF